MQNTAKNVGSLIVPRHDPDATQDWYLCTSKKFMVTEHLGLQIWDLQGLDTALKLLCFVVKLARNGHMSATFMV